MSNVKICWKGRVSESFFFEFWEERGEKLMTCHLFLDNFSWNFMTFGLFSKVKSFWNGFLFQENSNISTWYHEMFVFLNFVFRKRHVIAEIWLCFVLAIRGLLHMTKNFCHCGVILCVFKSLLRNLFLEKFS